MRRVIVIVVVVAALGWGDALAQDVVQEGVDEIVAAEPWKLAPSEFRGVPFGASTAEATTILGPMKCSRAAPGYWPAGTTHCSTRDKSMAFRVDGVVVGTRYVFHNNLFVGVEIGVTLMGLAALEERKPTFKTLNEAFTTKFGPPTRQRTVRYRTMEEVAHSKSHGSEFVPTRFTEQINVWENDLVRIEIARYRDVSLNRASVETAEWYRMKKTFGENQEKGSVTKF